MLALCLLLLGRMVKLPFKARAGQTPPEAPTPVQGNWRTGLPNLTGLAVSLRELRREDAASLLTMLSTPEVSRFLVPQPTTVEGFERFIESALKEREAGRGACFAIVPRGLEAAVGRIQVRSLEPGFGTAEWNVAMGSPFWGTGAFVESAGLAIDFTVDVVGAGRLEARVCVANGRGNGALRKIGAVQEGVLRRSFLRDGVYHDQVLWGILADDWRLQRQAERRMTTH